MVLQKVAWATTFWCFLQLGFHVIVILGNLFLQELLFLPAGSKSQLQLVDKFSSCRTCVVCSSAFDGCSSVRIDLNSFFQKDLSSKVYKNSLLSLVTHNNDLFTTLRYQIPGRVLHEVQGNTLCLHLIPYITLILHYRF